MMVENSYGSRPDLLPGFVTARHTDKRDQVLRLDLAASRELEAVTLNRFPATFSAALDWDGAPYEDRRWWDDEEDWARMAAELLAPYVEEGRRVAIFWGNLVIPTVTMPASVVVEHAREILDVGPHFWIVPLEDSVLIECLMDGQVTVAAVPST